MYVGDVGDGLNYIVYVILFMSEMSKIYKHVFAHNFLNIQQIFNPEKVLKKLRQGFPTIPSNTVYIKACWRCWR